MIKSQIFNIFVGGVSTPPALYACSLRGCSVRERVQNVYAPPRRSQSAARALSVGPRQGSTVVARLLHGILPSTILRSSTW